jgi:hypothetical protein
MAKTVTIEPRKKIYFEEKEKNESMAYIENMFGWESYNDAAADVLQDLKRQKQDIKSPKKR